MIDNNGRGVLSDWDHAGYKDKPARGIVRRIMFNAPFRCPDTC